MNDKDKTILLIDGSNLAFRMYFALEYSRLTSPDGRPSWAIFGFFKALIDAIEKEKPTTLITAFDTKQPTFRHEAVDYYKANRPDEMPDDLKSQWPEIKRGLELLGMSMVELPGYEADDLIGTLALQAANANWKVLILSGDRDNFQLVNDHVRVLMPGKKGLELIERAEVKEKMGIYPEQVVDFKSLCGDSSDNIPGVAGIGEKTACKLLNEFGNLENIFANLESISSASVRRKLIDGKASAEESKFLAKIKTDCPIAYPFDQISHPLNPNMPKLMAFLEEYKLTSLEKKLPKIFQAFGNHEHISQISEHKNKAKKAEKFSDNEAELSGEEDTDFPFSYEKDAVEVPKLQIQRKTILEEADLRKAFAEIKNSTTFSLDLETNGLNFLDSDIVGWALSWKKDEANYEAVYVPTKHNYLGAPNQLSNEIVAESLKALLTDWKGELVIQNLKFEYKFLLRQGIKLNTEQNNIIHLDTMLASYLENPDASHGLKNQALRIFQYPMSQIEDLIGAKGKKQKTMDQIAIEQVSEYACDDAALTLALYDHYQSKLNEKLKNLWINLESPLAIMLAEMELNGVYINSAKLAALSQEMSEQIKAYEERILEKLGAGSINLNSSQQLGPALAAKGFKLGKTQTGQLSTDSKLLAELKEQDSTGLIEEIMEYRALTKLRSTYTDSLPKQINGQTGRIHGEFNQALTTTGRLSSSNPNLQNIPVKNQKFGKLIRASFEAESNKILLAADYSQIELRILAHFTEDPTLLDAFRQEQDIHLRTAAEIFEIPPEKVTSDMRRLGKTLNFALIYQQGAFATARQLGISNKEAASFIEKYFKSFPNVRPFMENTLNEAREKGYVETLWGRRRYFKNLSAKSALLRKMEERQAFNAPLQGTASDIMKMAMLKINHKIKQEALNAKIILQVHDELVLEVSQEQADQISQILLTEMALNQPLKVPLEIQVGKGFNWADCK